MFDESASQLRKNLKRSSKGPSDLDHSALLAAIEAQETAVKLIPPCEFSQYKSMMAALPRPSDEQIDNYVDFVCEAHSWYKHLPLLTRRIVPVFH